MAEELHFSRAAARVFLAQQALSRQIRELEDELGVQLFIRSTRKVELTAAGEVFLEGARAALDAIDRAAADALKASRAVSGTLRVGFCPGAALELTDLILTEFRDRYPDVTLDLHEYPISDPTSGLTDGSSDVGFIRLPLSTEGLETEAVFTEPMSAMVSDRHPLAHRSSISARELLDETLTYSGSQDAVYRDFWLLNDFRDGKSEPKTVETTSLTEDLQLVASGGAVGLIVAAARRYVNHPKVRFLVIEDTAGSTLSLAWREGDVSPLAERLRAVVRTVRDRETETIDMLEHPPRSEAQPS